MNKDTKIIIGVIILLVIGGFLLWLFSDNAISWEESYDSKGKNPYDTYVITEMLKKNAHYARVHFINDATENNLGEYAGRNLNYVFIGDRLYSDSAKINQLIEFVERGNNAFISANAIPNYLKRIIRYECESDIIGDHIGKACKLSLVKNYNTGPVTLEYNFEQHLIQHNWNYIDSTAFCQYGSLMSVIGYANNEVNFIRFRWGEGTIFLHTTPLVFTNYFLLDPKVQQYAGNALSVLGAGDIIIDDWSKIPTYRNEEGESGGSPLQFILGQKSLRWAWYTAILLLVLYMIFFGKRRQKTIPVIERIKNTSHEYIKTVGLLYFMERSHRAACINKMKHFQLFIRNRYKILPAKNQTASIEKIHLVSGVDKKIIESIFEDFEYLEKRIGITDEYLIQFHNKLSQFYRTCK
jgi:hypothetical protein